MIVLYWVSKLFLVHFLVEAEFLSLKEFTSRTIHQLSIQP